MRLKDCYNFHDFRRMAKQRLPSPIFNYIDGAADDEVTYRRNTTAFEGCDLVPNVLRGVGDIDMSVTVMGQRLAMPVYCSPTALQRLFHHQGERAVAAAGRSSARCSASPRSHRQFWKRPGGSATAAGLPVYFHKDRGLNREMMRAAKQAGIE